MAQLELTLLWWQVKSSLEVDRDGDIEGAPARESHFKETTRTRFLVHVIDSKGWMQAKSHFLNESIRFDFLIEKLDEHGPLVLIAGHLAICAYILRLDFFVTIAESQAKVVQIGIVGVCRLEMGHLGLKLLWHGLLNFLLQHCVSD